MHDRDIIDGPTDVYLTLALFLHCGKILKLWHDFDRLPAVPIFRSSEREDWLWDVITDRNRDVMGFHFVRVDSLDGKRRTLIAEHSPCVEREREPICRHD